MQNLESSVMLIDDDGDEAYITGGHVDLLTVIKRAGGVGSRWKYAPCVAIHVYILETSEGLLFCGEDQVPGAIPITVVLEDENLLRAAGIDTADGPKAQRQTTEKKVKVN